MIEDRLQMIEKMLEENQNDAFLMYAAGLEYKKRDKSERTLELFYKLINNHPDYLATYYQLGKIHEVKGETEDAIKIYKQGQEVAKKQNDAKTLSELTEALYLLDDDA